MTENGKYEISIALDRHDYSTVKKTFPTIFVKTYTPLFVAICLYLNDDTIGGSDKDKEQKLNENSTEINEHMSDNEEYVTKRVGTILGVSPDKLKIPEDGDMKEAMLEKYYKKNNIPLISTSQPIAQQPKKTGFPNLGIRDRFNKTNDWLSSNFSWRKPGGVRRKSRRVRHRTKKYKVSKRRTYRR